MVESDKTLEYDDPVSALGSLQKEVGQSRDGDIWLFRAVKKIWKRKFGRSLVSSCTDTDAGIFVIGSFLSDRIIRSNKTKFLNLCFYVIPDSIQIF